ncbi:MAG: VCBS repeat-containing protein, partial [Clostridiales bacterium]
EGFRNDGYWLEPLDINRNGRLDLIGYGLGLGEVTWYKNPDWTKHHITTLSGPVGMHHADINGNGFNDIVVCYQYGKTMVDCDPEGGKIDWIENPGESNDKWKRHYVGKATAMHRLRVGHFTQNDKLEIIGLPIVGAPFKVHSYVPVTIFQQPASLSNATSWEKTVICDDYYKVIHGVVIKKHPRTNLDSLFLASEEGITWFYYEPELNKWQTKLLNEGELTQFGKTTFKGSGNIDVGKIGSDKFAYIATVEPFHGNTIAAYFKDTEDIEKAKWERVVLDVFDNPNEKGEGPAHHVVCADFDNDGEDEFLVALRGPMPWQGVFYYKAVDARKGIFTKWRVSSESAARIAVGDFNGDGTLDFATMGYSVEGYYCTENPKIMLYSNEMFKNL